jgi:hypothetical protein
MLLDSKAAMPYACQKEEGELGMANATLANNGFF